MNRVDEQAIFNVARKIPDTAAQSDYLQQVCGDNTALLARVRALLQVTIQRPEFLESPPSAVDVTADLTPVAERAGSTIDNYKLMEQIGEGGMGVVYVAEQEKPIRRRVALKVIKPGMDSKEVISRFSAERQALALMDHPNIAKVHDAGTTDTGRPYFVMELVRGVAITEYCDLNKFSARQRLELFIHVCHAVQHAHQKGVIHRDLKPSNVLVTEHDGTPVVKVIDLGVAKAINQQLTERTIYTRHQQMVGTPMYMSPEQAELSGLDVDTRSDIYSLGVLIYELLTGTTPFDKQRLNDAGYDEIRRIIREEEPSKPSTKVRTLGKAVETSSGYRGSDTNKLSQLLRGDLDWIVMKSLEKDRNRRYDTAKGLANDLGRYLNDETVLARPPSATYQFQKFARRNKTLLTSVLLVSLALLGGTSVAIWMAIEANHARKKQSDLAVLANQRADEARRFALSEAEARQEAQQFAKSEAAARQEARRLLYASDMRLAPQLLSERGGDRVDRILRRHVPRPGEKDLRNFEWYHLKWVSRRRWERAFDVQDSGGAVWAAVSPRSGVLAVAHQMGRVSLYDASSYEKKDEFVTDERKWGTYIALSPDGETLAYPDFDRVVLRDVHTGAVQPLHHQSVVSSFDFSPDNTSLAVLGIDQEITVWDIPKLEKRILTTDKVAAASGTAVVRQIAFSPDGSQLVSAHTDGSLRLWDFASKDQRFREWHGHRLPVDFIVFSRDGKLLVTRTADETKLWSVGGDALEPRTLTPAEVPHCTAVGSSPCLLTEMAKHSRSAISMERSNCGM